MTDTEEKHIFFLIINMWFGDTLWPIKANKPALVFTVTVRQQSKTDVCVGADDFRYLHVHTHIHSYHID